MTFVLEYTPNITLTNSATATKVPGLWFYKYILEKYNNSPNITSSIYITKVPVPKTGTEFAHGPKVLGPVSFVTSC